MNGSRESGANKDRNARFQVRCNHEPGKDIGAMGDRSWQGRRFAQSRDDVIGIREFVHGRNGDTRRRSGITGRAVLRCGRRAWRGSATGLRGARWSASSWLKPSRWRSRGEVDAVIAAHERAAGDCGCARDCGGRWSEIRVVTASPAMARSAELKASGVGALKGEGGACGARSEGQGGGRSSPTQGQALGGEKRASMAGGRGEGKWRGPWQGNR